VVESGEGLGGNRIGDSQFDWLLNWLRGVLGDDETISDVHRQPEAEDEEQGHEGVQRDG
jgi:hypothetical protein